MIYFIYIQKAKDFYEELHKEVNSYFTQHNKSDKWNWILYSKTIILLSLRVALYVLLLFSWQRYAIISIILYILFWITWALIWFNVMHDGWHGSYSKNKKINTITWYAMNILWSDINFWKISHNVLHHTYTNIEGYDDDIENRPIFRFHPDQKLKRFHKYQYIYWPIFYWFWLGNWIFYSDFRKFFKWSRWEHKLITLKFKDKIIFRATKLWIILFYYIIPATQIGWITALIGLIVMYYVMSLFIITIFQLAHIVEDTQMTTPIDYKVEENRAIHEINTTANFAMNSKFLSRILGGLNFQIEHHLFPKVSHIHYPNISHIVQKVCKKYDVKYNAYTTFFHAVKSHIRFIRKMWYTD